VRTGGRGDAIDRNRRGATLRTALDWLTAVVVPAVVVGLIFLVPFLRDLSQMPYGSDSLGYIWRTDLVYEGGINRLTPEVVGQTKTLGERPAHPITLSILRSLTGSDSLDLVRVLPGLLTAAIALAAGALAADGARERRRLSGVVGVGVAASVYVAYTAVGYSTNLAFDVVAIAAGTLAVRVKTGSRRREIAGLALLLTGGALYHWIFAVVFSGLLLVMATLLVLARRWRSDRGDASRPRPPVAGILIGVGSATILAAVLFLLFAPELPGRLPDILRTGSHSVNATAVRLPKMGLPIVLPLAALGALAISAGRDRQRRSSLALLVPWAAIALIGVITWYVLELPSPPYRWAGFALAIPMLIVMGFLSIPRMRPTRSAWVAGVGLALVAAAAFSAVGVSVWWNLDSKFDGNLIAGLRTVRTYVDRLPPDTTIVLPVRLARPSSPVRAGLGASLFQRVVFVRSVPKDLADVVPGPGVVLCVRALNCQPAEVPGVPLGDGVYLLEGPALDVAPAPIPRASGWGAVVGLAIACLIALTVAGLGWSLALTDLPVIGAVSIAPAFGLASLGIIGLVGNRAGVPLHGGGGVALFLSTALSGGLLAVAMLWLRRRTKPARGADRG
jgi:hypothetical protein